METNSAEDAADSVRRTEKQLWQEVEEAATLPPRCEPALIVEVMEAEARMYKGKDAAAAVGIDLEDFPLPDFQAWVLRALRVPEGQCTHENSRRFGPGDFYRDWLTDKYFEASDGTPEDRAAFVAWVRSEMVEHLRLHREYVAKKAEARRAKRQAKRAAAGRA